MRQTTRMNRTRFEMHPLEFLRHVEVMGGLGSVEVMDYMGRLADDKGIPIEELSADAALVRRHLEANGYSPLGYAPSGMNRKDRRKLRWQAKIAQRAERRRQL